MAQTAFARSKQLLFAQFSCRYYGVAHVTVVGKPSLPTSTLSEAIHWWSKEDAVSDRRGWRALKINGRMKDMAK